jgi:hypothetical protein
MPANADPVRLVSAPLLLLMTLTGCSSIPNTWLPQSAPAGAVQTQPQPPIPDAEALSVLDDLAPGSARTLSNGVAVSAEPVYTSASGQRCRAVRFEPPGRPDYRRLACSNSAGWQWVKTATPGFRD